MEGVFVFDQGVFVFDQGSSFSMRGALGLRSSLLGSSFSKHPQSGRGLEKSLHKFVGAVNDVVRMCFKSVEKIKGQ